MKDSSQLSELQLDILRTLWSRGEATVAEVHTALQRERGLAMTTVATVLSRLEKRGLVSHRTRGRQYVYSATQSESDVQTSMVEEFTQRLFGGDVESLVNRLLSDTEITPGDLARVKALIEAKEYGPKGRKDDDAE